MNDSSSELTPQGKIIQEELITLENFSPQIVLINN